MVIFRFWKVENKGYDWKHLVESYKEYVKKNDVVLEIGASTEWKTIELSKYCKRLIGVELLPERTPKNFKNIEYKIGDWQELTEFIPKESVNIIVSSHVIEHVPDDLKAVNEMYKVLKPGGIAIINTPCRTRLTRTMIELFIGRRKFPWREHVREYAENDLKNLALKSMFKNNFKIIPFVFGLHGGYIFLYLERTPRIFWKWANYLEMHLFKGKLNNPCL